MRQRSARVVPCLLGLSGIAWTLAFPSPARALVSPVDSLKHHWALDESGGPAAADSAGEQIGTLVNGPVWRSSDGMHAGALEFDGVDDYVALGTLDAPPGPGLSIAFWMKADDFDVPDGRLISKSAGLLTSDHYWMVSTVNSTALRFRLKAGGTTTTLTTATGEVGTGTWHHVVVTHDGSRMRIYKDGVEVASVLKSGAVNTNAAVGVAIGGQPAGAGSAPFDGLIDDVRIYNRALSQIEVSAMSGDPTITLWYGDTLHCGHLGVPQRWVNVVGSVTGAERVDSLYYTLNGGPASQLTVGPDGYRLINPGDFNIEIDHDDLAAGPNDVLITAVDIHGQHSNATVTVHYTNGMMWSRPDTLEFESAASISDEACVIDGRWSLVAGGVRTDATAIGYDRLLAAGQGADSSSAWPSDLDVVAPITIHNYINQSGKRGAIGVGFGWQGHNGPEQPSLGHKYQAIAFIRDVTTSPVLTLYRVSADGYIDALKASTPASVSLGVRYLMRMRSESFSADSSHVSVKLWEDGAPEPIGWDLESNFKTIKGSVLLISHYAESTFGNTIIQPLTPSHVPTAQASIALAQNAPNPFGEGTTIRYGLSAAGSAELEIFDVRGRRIHRAALPAPGPGWYEYHLDSSDVGGRALPAGVYFYKVRIPGASATRKMILIR